MGLFAHGNGPRPLSQHRRMVGMAAVVLAAVAGIAVWHTTTRSPAPPTHAASRAAPTPRPPSLTDRTGPGGTSSSATPDTSPGAGPRFDLSQLPPPTAATRQLVQGVWQRSGSSASMSGEERARWEENWNCLRESGETAVPALAEYLRGDQDTFFSAEDSAEIGFRSAREAAIEALSRLNSPASQAVMADALATTASPREVALLARALENAAPGQYRNDCFSAVRESLEMAASRQLGSLDVAPLFEVLQTFGGPDAVTELERAAKRWGPYATLVLASLPDAAGVPALLQMADPAPGTKPHAARLQALQAVAQLATTHDAARTNLLEQTRANRIPPNLWPYLIRPLAGQEARLRNALLHERPTTMEDPRASSVHIASTNQNLSWVPPDQGIPPDQIRLRTSLIAELRAATTDPDAHRTLDQTESLLGLQ